jgi:hypothetical protein
VNAVEALCHAEGNETAASCRQSVISNDESGTQGD